LKSEAITAKLLQNGAVLKTAATGDGLVITVPEKAPIQLLPSSGWK